MDECAPGSSVSASALVPGHSKTKKTRGDDSEDETEEAVDQTDEKKFRLTGKHFFLTYSQTDLTPEKVWKHHKAENHSAELVRMKVGDEKHVDGHRHLHVLLTYNKKLDTRNVRFFDINGEHPNIRKVKKAHIPHKIDYLSKDGHVTDFGEWNPYALFAGSTNYIKKVADHQQYILDSEEYGKPKPFPFKLPDDETEIPEPKASDKKRHWLICGPPDLEKSYWVEKTLAGKKYYERPQNDYPFEKGTYKQQQVIIYDDFVPSLSEVINVSNTSADRKLVFGNSRFHANYWPKNSPRVMIILCNPERVPKYVNDPAFLARFNFLTWKLNKWIKS